MRAACIRPFIKPYRGKTYQKETHERSIHSISHYGFYNRDYVGRYCSYCTRKDGGFSMNLKSLISFNKVALAAVTFAGMVAYAKVGAPQVNKYLAKGAK